MNALPKISIITISRNSEATIERTIRSVIEQTYPDKEYIIIDGLSEDGTMAIVDRYKDDIDIIVSEKDTGISNAFNKGITRAHGDLIVLLNSDDYLLPDALSTVARTWDGKSEIWSGNYLAENGDKRYRIKPSISFPVMPFFRKVVHQGRFITKGLYERIGMYDEEIKRPMDLEFMMRAYRRGATFQRVDVDVAVFTLGGATAESIFRKKDDYVSMVRKNGGTIVQAYLFYIFLVITQETKRLLSLSAVSH